MALIIPFGYAQVSIPHRHSGLARSAVVTIGVRLPELTFPTSDLADTVTAAYQAAWQTTIAAEVTVGPTRMAVGANDGTTYTVEGTTTFAGTNTTEKIAPNNALIVRKITERGGRRGRGRLFMPWVLNETDVNEVGQVTSSVASNAGVAWKNFQVDLLNNVEPLELVVLHSEGQTPAGDPDDIVGFVGDPTVGSQRRRRGR